MSNPLTRRELLAGALVLPWLASCGTEPGTATGPRATTTARPTSPEPTSSGTPTNNGPSQEPSFASPTPASPSPASPAPNELPVALHLEEGIIASRFWPDKRVRWRLARPVNGPVADSQPLVVALHGHGGNADWAFKRAHLERHVVRTGLAVASVDGGNFYWHARRSGVDPVRLVLRDLLPLLGAKGLDIERIGLIGWSMGGYGALLLASRLGPRRVAGVVAVSAALWQSPAAGGTDAFDGYADFARNDVFAARRRLERIPVRLDCGRGDQFVGVNQLLANELPTAATTFDNGGHTEDYWRAHAGDQMRWLRRRLR